MQWVWDIQHIVKYCQRKSLKKGTFRGVARPRLSPVVKHTKAALGNKGVLTMMIERSKTCHYTCPALGMNKSFYWRLILQKKIFYIQQSAIRVVRIANWLLNNVGFGTWQPITVTRLRKTGIFIFRFSLINGIATQWL